MKLIRSLATYTVAFLVLSPLALPSNARADDAELAQVLKALKTVETRVATLESENQQYRREAASARVEAQALKQKLGRQPNPNVAVQLPPSGSYAMVTKAPLLAAVPTWGGFYAGASFGIASQRAHKDETDPSSSTQTQVTATTTDTFVNSDAFASSLGGHGPGAMINLYLGYNHMLTDNVLVGGQIEGGVSNMRTRLTGTSSEAFQSSSTFTSPGFTNVDTSSSLSTGNTTDHLDNRWMMSALVRGGAIRKI